VPIDNIAELDRTRSRWAKKSLLPGVSVNLDEQAKKLETICAPFQHEYAGNRFYRDSVRQGFGPGFGAIEAQALHGVVRYFKPRTVIEVGAGITTACIAAAAALNKREGHGDTRILSIEPYPSPALLQMQDAKIMRSMVQDVPLDTFQQLGNGDMLFVDSSHAVRPGGDVNFLILEVLPRLPPGVVVHFHDIYLPFDYPRDVLHTYFHWQETSLLRAYLTENTKTRVLFCLSQLHYDRQQVLRSVFPDYRPAPDEDGLAPDPRREQGPSEEVHFPASIYIERI
jgi:predicted O-methyltransferase YrrM